MRLSIRIAISAAALSALWCAGPNAEACPPAEPGLASSVPKEGDNYPGNSVLFFSGHLISLDNVAVTVDGKPAGLTPAGALVPGELGGIRVLIDPPPAGGESVTVEGAFCDGCKPVVIHYTASAPDVSAPPPPSGVSFDIHDYVDFKSSGGDCQIDSDLAWWIDIEEAPAAPDEARVIVTVEAFHDMALQDLAFARSSFVSGEKTAVLVRSLATLLNGTEAPDALCFRASALDSAGNKAGNPVVVCKPCHYRADSGQAAPEISPPEPEWSAADQFPGGTCLDGAGGGAGAGGAGGNGSGGGGAAGGGDAGEDGNEEDSAPEASGCSAYRAAAPSGDHLPGLASAAVLIASAGFARRLSRRRRSP